MVALAQIGHIVTELRMVNILVSIVKMHYFRFVSIKLEPRNPSEFAIFIKDLFQTILRIIDNGIDIISREATQFMVPYSKTTFTKYHLLAASVYYDPLLYPQKFASLVLLEDPRHSPQKEFVTNLA